MKLSDLKPVELSAALRGGTAEWGQRASAIEHVRYAKPAPSKMRRRCHCGCKRRAAYIGCANGIALIHGCELEVSRWVKDPQLIYDRMRAHYLRRHRQDAPDTLSNVEGIQAEAGRGKE